MTSIRRIEPRSMVSTLLLTARQCLRDTIGKDPDSPVPEVCRGDEGSMMIRSDASVGLFPADISIHQGPGFDIVLFAGRVLIRSVLRSRFPELERHQFDVVQKRQIYFRFISELVFLGI